MPDLGLCFTLPRAIGAGRARDMPLTNRRIGADEALRIGLVARLASAEKLDGEACALATQLAQGPVSLGYTRSLFNAAAVSSASEYLPFEALMQVQAFASEDFAEGVAAFRKKRRPVFGAHSSN